MKRWLAGGGIVGVVVCASCALAQTQGGEGLSQHCRQVLSDIQADRQVCVIGLVDSEKTVRVLFSTAPGMVGKSVAMFKTKMQEGAMLPLDELASLKNRMIAVGGLSDGDSIFSARVL